MQTVMYTHTIFGPIHSRRLGSSLGVNLMPNDGKICSFDCLYCEAGFNAQGKGTTGLPDPLRVAELLEAKLGELKSSGQPLNSITFSGNGEPTLHPQFPDIINSTLALRDRYFPDAKVSVLSNATMLHKPDVVAALKKVDNPILKLDSAINQTAILLNRPTNPRYSTSLLVEQLTLFGHQAIIQTLLTKGCYKGQNFDNSSDVEIDALIKAYLDIRPRSIMLYSLDRPTPNHSLQKIDHQTLLSISERIHEATNIPVSIPED